IQEAVAKLAASKNARRYPPSLRAQITAYGKRQIAAGMSVAAVCRELDVGEPTLHGFLGTERPSEKRGPRFKRVRGVSTELPGAQVVQRIVRGPCSLLVEGLSVDEIAQ